MAGGIKLQWKDRNFSEEQHRIYKSDTPMTLGMLPTPIATLGSNITEYIDYDVIEGNTYYYRISAVRGSDEAVSDELMMVAEELNFGPGGQELIAGDMTAGFFGEVPTSELITGDDLAIQIGLTQGTTQFSNEPWLKFALDGNIIYVAKKAYRHSVSWEHIYQAGAVYGTNDNGSNPSGANRIQDANINVDGYSLDVTLLRGANTDPTGTDNAGYDIDYTHTSEWNRLMYPIHSGVHTSINNPSTPSVPYAQWVSYSDEDLLVHNSFGSGSYSWTQETPSTSANRLGRGVFGVTRVLLNTATYLNTNNGWRPALRLNL